MSLFETFADITRPSSCRPQSPMEKLHSMIHNASYLMEQGDIDGAKDQLRKADILTHDEIEKESAAA